MLALLLSLASVAGVVAVTVDSPVAVSVDGITLEYAGDADVAIAPGLSGRHRVTVHGVSGRELWGGHVDVPGDKVVWCRWRARVFDCYERVPVAVSESTGVHMRRVDVHITEPAVEPRGAHHHAAEPTRRPPPPKPPDRVQLVVRSSDGEWADVSVDGERVMELRNEAEMSAWISPGQHLVEVREFLEDRPYSTGRLDTGLTDRVTLGITEGQPIRCFDHDGFRAQ